MAKNVTRDTLRLNARLYADQRGTTNAFITDTEVNRLINVELGVLYDKLVEVFGADYYATTSNVAVVANTASYALPATFYQLLGVIALWGNNQNETLETFAAARFSTDLQGYSWAPGSPKAYRLLGSNIEFTPTPTMAVTVQLRFVPAFQDLTSDATLFDSVNGWDDAVALGVAMRMRAIEEQPFGDLTMLYDRQMERIERMARMRSRGPDQIIDREAQAGGPWPTRLF